MRTIFLGFLFSLALLVGPVAAEDAALSKIERDVSILHPHGGGLRRAEIKQHAPVAGQALAEHQAALA